MTTLVDTPARFHAALRSYEDVELTADIVLTTNVTGIKPPTPVVIDLAGYQLSSTSATTGIIDFANVEVENGRLGRLCFAMGQRLKLRDVSLRNTLYLRGALDDVTVDRYDATDLRGRAFYLSGAWGTARHLVDNFYARDGVGLRLGDDFAYLMGVGLAVFEGGKVSDISEVLYGPDSSVQHADCFQSTGTRYLIIRRFDIANVLGWQGAIVHPSDGKHPQMNERLLLEDVTFHNVGGHDVMLISAGHCTLRRVTADIMSIFYARDPVGYDPASFRVETDDCRIGRILYESPTPTTPWRPGPRVVDITPLPPPPPEPVYTTIHEGTETILRDGTVVSSRPFRWET